MGRFQGLAQLLKRLQIHLPALVLASGLAHAAAASLEVAKPVSFVGTLPCADCPGIDWHLDLWPDGRFQLNRRYRERGDSDDDLGRWRINPANDSLLLYGGREAPLRIAVKNPSTLRLLDLRGNAIVSELPYDLKQLPVFTPSEISLRLGGEFRYFADAATFMECRTGNHYPVLMEGDYINAERRYLESVRESDAPQQGLFLQIEGGIVNRQAMEPEGPMQSLRIERLLTDVPRLRCERAMSEASLPNTYWRLLRMDGQTIDTPEGQREVHLVLHDADNAVAGFSGCNRFRGGYTLNGDRLSFSPLAATKMACPEPSMSIENPFRQHMQKVTHWRIAGQTLELLATDSRTPLVFEAVYLP